MLKKRCEIDDEDLTKVIDEFGKKLNNNSIYYRHCNCLKLNRFD